MSSRFLAWFLAAAISTPALSGRQLVEQMQTQYRTEGAQEFSVEQGKILWQKEFINKKGEKRACTACHGSDLTQPGQHAITKKAIKPMAVSVNKARLKDERKVRKWLKRNCKWTLGRECSSQEKGDILEYILSQ